jgi:amino acid transporter
MNPENFFGELKRRNVYKVALTYAVIACLLLALLLLPSVEAPAWAIKTFLVFLVLGFALTAFISWAFEATPEGMKRTEKVPRDAILPTWSPRKFAAFIITVALLAASLLVFDLLRSQSKPPSPPTTAAP